MSMSMSMSMTIILEIMNMKWAWQSFLRTWAHCRAVHTPDNHCDSSKTCTAPASRRRGPSWPAPQGSSEGRWGSSAIEMPAKFHQKIDHTFWLNCTLKGELGKTRVLKKKGGQRILKDTSHFGSSKNGQQAFLWAHYCRLQNESEKKKKFSKKMWLSGMQKLWQPFLSTQNDPASSSTRLSRLAKMRNSLTPPRSMKPNELTSTAADKMTARSSSTLKTMMLTNFGAAGMWQPWKRLGEKHKKTIQNDMIEYDWVWLMCSSKTIWLNFFHIIGCS